MIHWRERWGRSPASLDLGRMNSSVSSAGDQRSSPDLITAKLSSSPMTISAAGRVASASSSSQSVMAPNSGDPSPIHECIHHARAETMWHASVRTDQR